MKVLLVDDEIVALNALKKRVDWVKYGFTETFTAQNAAAAREILEKNKIDLVMCDIEMPGENGLSLVEFIRNTYPDTECMMVTCHTDFNYLKQSMRNRVWDYVLKPIDYEELDTILTQFAESKTKEMQKIQLQRVVDKALEKRDEDSDTAAGRVEQAKKYIEEHIQQKIYVEDLAKLVHVNEQYFMRIFKKETGQSVTEYITERRMVLASLMLKDTDRSINFIADAVGCENYSYFTKLFRRFTGFTPKEYRAQFKGSQN